MSEFEGALSIMTCNVKFVLEYTNKMLARQLFKPSYRIDENSMAQ